jgi:hypothetical protein
MKPLRRAGTPALLIIFLNTTTSGKRGKGVQRCPVSPTRIRKIISGAFNNIPDHV